MPHSIQFLSLPKDATPLFSAVARQNFQEVETLLKDPTVIAHQINQSINVKQENLNKKISYSNDYIGDWTPLHLACINGLTEIAIALIEKGADIHKTRVKTGSTSVSLACLNDNFKLVEFLLSKGANESVTENRENGATNKMTTNNNSNNSSESAPTKVIKKKPLAISNSKSFTGSNISSLNNNSNNHNSITNNNNVIVKPVSKPQQNTLQNTLLNNSSNDSHCFKSIKSSTINNISSTLVKKSLHPTKHTSRSTFSTFSTFSANNNSKNYNYQDENQLDSEDYQELGFIAWMNHFLESEACYQGSQLLEENENENQDPNVKVVSLVSSEKLFVEETISTKILPALKIRSDISFHSDSSTRKLLVSLLLQYNLPWLHFGLEKLFGKSVSVKKSANNNANTNTTSDEKTTTALTQFIQTHILFDEKIAARFAVPGVPNCYREGYETALHNHVVTQFLSLVHFLDAAKLAHLLSGHLRGLFQSNSKLVFETDSCCVSFKSSKDILAFFSRHFLAGEGDFIKHLSYLGYYVSYTQTLLDEYDFKVVNLSTDLCDGVRLVKLAELLTNDFTLTSQLKLPAEFVAQKQFNVDIALGAFSKCGLSFHEIKNGAIKAKDIVSSHREKTLALLWRLLLRFKVQVLVSTSQLATEINKITNRLPPTLLSSLELSSTMYFTSDKISLLLKWAQLICCNYNLLVRNFTSSFSDGRAFCFLINYYLPNLLPRELIHEKTANRKRDRLPKAGNRQNGETNSSNSNSNDGENVDDDDDDDENEEDNQVAARAFSKQSDQEWTATFSFEKTKYASIRDMRRAESVAENFSLLERKMAEMGGIPLMIKYSESQNMLDEKVVIGYVSYLCSRLLELSNSASTFETPLALEQDQQKSQQQQYHQQQHQQQQQQQQQQQHQQQQQQCVQEQSNKIEVETIEYEESNEIDIETQEKYLAFAVTKIQAWWRGYSTRKSYLELKRQYEKYLEEQLQLLQEQEQQLLLQLQREQEQRELQEQQERQEQELKEKERQELERKQQQLELELQQQLEAERKQKEEEQEKERKQRELLLQQQLEKEEEEKRKQLELELQQRLEAERKQEEEEEEARKQLEQLERERKEHLELLQKQQLQQQQLQQQQQQQQLELSAAIKIQSFVRGRKQRLCYLTTRQYIIKVQAVIRGHQARKRVNAKLRKINEIKQRLSQVNTRVKEFLKLGNMSFDKTMMTEAHSAVPIIFSLILNCNRSQPHLEILQQALNTLIHLSMCTTTVDIVFNQPNSVSIIAELIQIYRDKQSIFLRACKLLTVLCQDTGRLGQVKKMTAIVGRLQNICINLQKKYNLEQKLKALSVSNKFSSATSSSLSSLSSATVVSPRSSKKEANPVQVIEELINLLK